MTIKLFISYSHKDEEYRKALEIHLTHLKRDKLIETWHDREMSAGANIPREIRKNMQEADIILLLFSPSFIGSEECKKEMDFAKALKKEKSTVIVPIILHKCSWQHEEGMADTLALPKDGKHIVSWEDQNEAWHSVYCGIKAKAEEIKKKMHLQAKTQTKAEIQKVTSAVADTGAPKTEKENKRKTTERKLQNDLNEALSYYEGQPTTWTDRVMYQRKGATHMRAYEDEINIEQLIRNPYSLLVFDKPISGFTCLARYLILKAWKKGRNWLYLDADKIPLVRENVKEHVEKECQKQDFSIKSLRCLILDGWQQEKDGMPRKLRYLSSELKDIPLIVMSSGENVSSVDKEKAKREFCYAGLKPLTRHGIRKIVEEHNAKKNFNEDDDVVVCKVVSDMEILNIHRTPEHCLTLLKAYEKSFSETPANRAKMLSVLLTVLFDMMPEYKTDKPSADHCAFLFGFFCEKMIKEEKHSFGKDDFLAVSKNFLKEQKLTLKPNVIFDILHKNRIIIETGSRYKFRHVFWTYYFAAHRMRKDKDFYKYIMSDEMYLSFPDVIEFFAGIDGDRDDLIETLANDLRAQCESMENELGAKDVPITPLDLLKRIDDKESVSKRLQYVRKEIMDTNLPYSIKDEHADKRYDISRPDDQSLYKAYKEHKFSSLRFKLHACCRALRNSEFVAPDKKTMMMAEIMRGWALFAKITFMLSPAMVRDNKAFWEGFGFILDNKMEKVPPKQKLYFIWADTPHNVVDLFEDDLHSDRLSDLFEEKFQVEKDRLIRHLLAIFLIRKKPQCWMNLINGYMRAVKMDSVYYANVHDQLIDSYQYDFATNMQIADMKHLISLWYARRLYTGGKHGPADKNLKHKAIKLQGQLTFPPRKVEDEE